jgi:putative transcriptional regulator
MLKTFKSQAMAAIHEMLEGFEKSGTIDKQTMREFDEVCLSEVDPTNSDSTDLALCPESAPR